MNVNEYGIVFAFYVAFDMSANTALSITFTKPDGTKLTVTDPAVTAPAIPIVTPAGTFAASQYAQYTFAEGDVDQAGLWSARVTYFEGADIKLISDPGTFTVKP